MSTDDPLFTPDDLIFSYTRAEALADGVLIDVSAHARELGFKHPFALTAAAFGECVAVPANCPDQDLAGRLHDVLFMAILAAMKAGRATCVTFQVSVVTAPGCRETKTLELHGGPGDDAEPVLTLMMQGED